MALNQYSAKTSIPICPITVVTNVKLRTKNVFVPLAEIINIGYPLLVVVAKC